ncbi:MAG: hypothetical protein AAB780_01955 [Patescibacteria group bacterium]
MILALQIFKGIKRLLSLVGEAFRLIINTLLAGTTYIVGIGPVSIIGKLCGKEFMKMKLEPHTSTYWDKAETSFIKSDYYRQF